ncbi:MAG: PBSX family phage terminase large subunit [Fusobacteriaceae bacterium]
MTQTRTLDFTNPKLYVNWITEYTKALYDPKIRYIFLKGSAGAGKSVVASQLTLQEVCEGLEYAWIRKIRATVKNSCYQALYNQAKSWKLREEIEFQKSLNAESKISDGKILFLGLDDPEKIKSLADLDRIVCEEATDLTYDDFTQLDIRLRGRKNQKLICLFNPVSDQHWLKTKVKDNSNWDWSKTVWIEKTVLDNKFADQQYIESLKRLEQTNPEMYKVYFKNEWGQAKKGLIFPDFTVGSEEFEPDTAGLDFGYNDPTVLVYSRIVDMYPEIDLDDEDNENDVYYTQPKKKLQLREVLYETGLTETTLIARFEQLQVSKSLKIYADGSRPELIRALQNAGYNVVATTKGAGSVYTGIMQLKEYDIELIDSPNGVKEFQNYSWVEKGGTILDQEPKGGFDHFIDSARYSLNDKIQKSSAELSNKYLQILEQNYDYTD